MKSRISKITAFLIGLVLLIAPAPAHAQTQFDFITNLYRDGLVASVTQVAVSTDTALLIRYVGTQMSGTVDVSAAGLITFKHGAIGAEVVDTSVECDASIAVTGSRNGIWDVSVAACNTITEGAGIINSQVTSTATHNWIIVPLDALGTDDLSCSGNGCLVTVTGQSATSLDGYAAKWDTAVTFTSTIALLPASFRSMKAYVSGTQKPITLKVTNPFSGYRTVIGVAEATSTYGSGTSLYAISQVLPSYFSTTQYTEVISTVRGSVTGGATTVAKAYVSLSDNMRLFGNEGQKVVLRLTNSAALTAPLHNAYGIFYPTVVNSRP